MVIGCLGPMVGTVVVAVNPPGPSAQMAIAEAAGPCPEDTALSESGIPRCPLAATTGQRAKKKVLLFRSASTKRGDDLQAGKLNQRARADWQFIKCSALVLRCWRAQYPDQL